MKMEKIPLAQRLDSAAVVNARWLIGQYARLFCNDYFPSLDELMDTNYRGPGACQWPPISRLAGPLRRDVSEHGP